MKAALDVYLEAAKTVYDINLNDKDQSEAVLMQSSMCYKMVLDGIRHKMGLDGESEEEDPSKSDKKIINM
jgi:hypothetical protein